MNDSTYPLAIPTSTGPSSPYTFQSTYAADGQSSAWNQIGATAGEGQQHHIYTKVSSFSVPAENIYGSSAAVTYPNIVCKTTYTAVVATSQGTLFAAGPPAQYLTNYAYSWSAGTPTYFPCTYNEIQKYFRQDGSSTATAMDAQLTYLNNKLSDLNSNAIDDPFEDGLTSAGNAPIITDAAFDAEVDELIANTATANTAHNNFTFGTATVAGVSVITGTYNAQTQFGTFWSDQYTFLNTTVPNRIAEITARIGYLDKMPPSSGGDTSLTQKSYTTSGGTATFSTLGSPDSNFRSNPAQTADDGGGWQGYAFKDTNGSGTCLLYTSDAADE